MDDPVLRHPQNLLSGFVVLGLPGGRKVGLPPFGQHPLALVAPSVSSHFLVGPVSLLGITASSFGQFSYLVAFLCVVTF